MTNGGFGAALENLLFHALSVSAGERVIFIHDCEFREICHPLKTVAATRGIKLDTFEIQYDGIRSLDSATAGLIEGTEYSVILFGTVHNIWHTPERKRAKYELGKRLASIVCSPEDIGGAGCLAEVSAIGAATRQMAGYFVTGESVHVRTRAGSDFRAVIETPFCEHGNYQAAGTGGDFPSGEVGFGPRVGSVNGRIVYDVKVQHIGVLSAPLHLQVKDDRVCEIQGPNARRFREICAARGDVLNYISEISIGLNPLEGVSANPAYIPEEKSLGTLHCGHGGNASYGERRGPHIDGVMARPTLLVGDQMLMQDGVILPGLIEESVLTWLRQKP